VHDVDLGFGLEQLAGEVGDAAAAGEPKLTLPGFAFA
jgi:hypothetical protein